jgi:ABC-type multidrug transport system fused ATPase/permease subunit
LIDLIMGLHKPSEGKMLVDNTQISRNNLASWRASIGYVPQEIFLIDDTVARNIAFGIRDDDIDEESLREACRIAQILDFIELELPQGFQTKVGDRGARLSGGQRQRLGLARALYRKPELLILDEATSALDTETEEKVVQAINLLKGKMTMIIVAHRLNTVREVDTKYQLQDGRIMER